MRRFCIHGRYLVATATVFTFFAILVSPAFARPCNKWFKIVDSLTNSRFSLILKWISTGADGTAPVARPEKKD
jgi:hypothetical protein